MIRIADSERQRWTSVVLALALAPTAPPPGPPEPEQPVTEEPAIDIPSWGRCGFSGDVQAGFAYARGDLQAAVDAILEEADAEREPDPDKYRLARLYARLYLRVRDPGASLADLRAAIRIDDALGGRYLATLVPRLRERLGW